MYRLAPADAAISSASPISSQGVASEQSAPSMPSRLLTYNTSSTLAQTPNLSSSARLHTCVSHSLSARQPRQLYWPTPSSISHTEPSTLPAQSLLSRHPTQAPTSALQRGVSALAAAQLVSRTTRSSLTTVQSAVQSPESTSQNGSAPLQSSDASHFGTASGGAGSPASGSERCTSSMPNTCAQLLSAIRTTLITSKAEMTGMRRILRGGVLTLSPRLKS